MTDGEFVIAAPDRSPGLQHPQSMDPGLRRDDR